MPLGRVTFPNVKLGAGRCEERRTLANFAVFLLRVPLGCRFFFFSFTVEGRGGESLDGVGGREGGGREGGERRGQVDVIDTLEDQRAGRGRGEGRKPPKS